MLLKTTRMMLWFFTDPLLLLPPFFCTAYPSFQNWFNIGSCPFRQAESMQRNNTYSWLYRYHAKCTWRMLSFVFMCCVQIFTTIFFHFFTFCIILLIYAYFNYNIKEGFYCIKFFICLLSFSLAMRSKYSFFAKNNCL